MNINTTTEGQHIRVEPIISASTQNLICLVFGVIVLFAVGFLPMDVAHNAAHDTRHILAFPCH